MDFADVLDGLGRAAPAEEAGFGRRAGTSEFWEVLDGFSRRGTIDRQALREAYGTEPAPDLGIEPELSTDPDDIAFELDLAGARSQEALRTLRRAFARINHPDRVAPAYRERANRRMTIANALIDEAAARLPR